MLNPKRTVDEVSRDPLLLKEVFVKNERGYRLNAIKKIELRLVAIKRAFLSH